MHRRTRRLVAVAAGSAVLWSAGLAFADPLDPVRTFTGWTGNTQQDFADPQTGRYQFDSGFVGATRRARASASQRYTPERMSDPATVRVELQSLYDDVLHNRPTLPDNNLMEAGVRDLLPDWDGDGTFGDGGTATEPGDFDGDVDRRRDAAWFRYPEFHDDGSITHPGGLGAALEAGFVNSRGLFLDATLWVPGDLVDALDPETDAVALRTDDPRPGIAFANGFSSRQDAYYWFAMGMVARGFVVMTYDPAGQGDSDGTGADLLQQPNPTGCQFAACIDVQDAMRWFAGGSVELNPALIGPAHGQLRPFATSTWSGDLPANPVVDLIDTDRLGLAGNSMGALSTVNYLHHLGNGGTGTDGRPLPALAAAVAMSGADPDTAFVVPTQLQTSDYDGSPALIAPSVLGTNLGSPREGIGYYPIKRMFDKETAETPGADASLVVLDGGTHLDHAEEPFVPRTLWATRVAEQYAGTWFACYLLGDDGACDATTLGDPHLSKAFGSELYRGPGDLRCLKAPTEISLNYDPRDLAGGGPRGCHQAAPGP